MCFCLAFEIALFRMFKLFEGPFTSELSSALKIEALFSSF